MALSKRKAQEQKKKDALSRDRKTLLGADSGIIIQNFPGYFLLACIIFSALFLIRVFAPFITVLLVAAILSTAFYPLYLRILKVFKERDKVASLVTCFLVLFLIIVPLIFFIFLLGRQAYDIYHYIQDVVHQGLLDPYLKWGKGGLIYDVITNITGQFNGVVDLSSIDLKSTLTETAKGIAQFLAAQSANILKGFGGLLIDFFVLLFAMYYFFKDGEFIIQKLMTLSPLPDKHEEELFRKFKEISLATLYGIFLTSIVQGIVAGLGFAIVGIPNSFFWGTAVAIFSLVPVVGTSIIWLPASVVLLATGNLGGGIFLFLWGLLLVSTIDNFLRAFVIGGRTKTNQLLTFLAVFGGLLSFGLVGVIFGPLILTLFFAFLHIYESEYDRLLHKK